MVGKIQQKITEHCYIAIRLRIARSIARNTTILNLTHIGQISQYMTVSLNSNLSPRNHESQFQPLTTHLWVPIPTSHRATLSLNSNLSPHNIESQFQPLTAQLWVSIPTSHRTTLSLNSNLSLHICDPLVLTPAWKKHSFILRLK